MFGRILHLGQQAFTCRLVGQPTRNVHMTTSLYVLDKDVRNKKTIFDFKTIADTDTEQSEDRQHFQLSTPTAETHSMMIAGTRYDQLPIAYIQATHNNTIMCLTDYKGMVQFHHSCGIEGFKNAKKGTTIAAQATGLTVGQKALSDGLKHVRIKVKGIGPGRLPAIKGLQMAGLTIVSITDNTPIVYYNRRPRKKRRL